ncbi:MULTISPECIES: glycosyltransferase family 2 protein [Bradyrhizobium]|uniref:Glycosyltransferase family 2 protein n=1 Tax=Bradyrhizobium aeschynomenes TaxID=2734909 RepID=A0ABX2CID6_9BRAD|nr:MULTISPECIES: glycosyltransferase family A protein [Bradyrhizobium]NPU12416.1 glycosyltransferase family 2 protein [Bradyrhizobium aeschynomenes]NPU67648.1 glycosyltransferase family 2 protein [Bradyrhizobium aeschynomenes]
MTTTTASAASPTVPTVTLVVPNFNHAHYLSESLGSIANQTRAPDRVIIIDDCSTDDSIAVISRFLADRPSWRLIRHEINQGVVRGQNEALAIADTDWIGFLGADDALHPTYLEKAMAQAADHPDAGLIFACCEIIGPNGPSARRMLRPIMLPASASTMLAPADVRRILRVGDNYFSGTTSLYRRSALQALGGFDVKLGSFSDAFLARRLGLTYGCYFIADALGYWRIHGQNYSTATATDPASLNSKLAEIGTLIAESQLFPQGYGALFARRNRFGAARTVLGGDTAPSAKAARVSALLGGTMLDTQLLRLTLSFGAIGRVAALAWVTLRTRPMSLTRLLAQTAARRSIISATPGYRAR